MPLPPQPAYNYSVENQALKEAQQHQQNHINHMHSTIAGETVSNPQTGPKERIQQHVIVLKC